MADDPLSYYLLVLRPLLNRYTHRQVRRHGGEETRGGTAIRQDRFVLWCGGGVV